MKLTSGSRLGHYEIAEPLGAGGMGEVYRARDVRLGRDVAVKVLPENVSMNPEVRARFEREAKTISSLNHPHICTLHDIGREGHVDYLVMELVEGETLDERLARGPLPSADVLKVGSQIADALDRAHRAGVVHRDLKPGNVMLTRAGAKLMDFGLARVTKPSSAGMDKTIAQLSESPTEAQPLTAEGTIVGTFQYMAPEQLEGGDVDERTDLWALGCVLYEMATGKRAFDGKSQASLIGAIMHKEPSPVSQVVSVTPPQLDRLVSACLAKDPHNRVQSAHDVKLQLEWIAEGTTSTAGAPAVTAGRRGSVWARTIAVTAVAVVLTAVVSALLFRGHSNSDTTTPQRYIVGSADLRPSSAPALSPDGSYVVFSLNEGPSCRLFRRDESSLDMTPIPGTEEGRGPFFSPDGAWIGFCTPDAVKKIPAGGGAAQLVTSYPSPSAGDWGEDGTIYLTSSAGGEDGNTALARVADTGGRVETVAMLDRESGDGSAWLPEILPDGKTVLVSIIGSGSYSIVAFRPDGSRSTVIENAFLARYVDSGYIFYRDDESGAVLAAPFDPAGLRVTGPAIPLTEPVNSSYCYDVLADGRLVYVPIPGAGQGARLMWVDREGQSQPLVETRSDWAQPRMSPDGGRILLRKVGDACELWMYDIKHASLSRIVQTDDNHDPIWSPDGTHIAFARETAREMVTLSVTGPRETRVVTAGQGVGAPQSWIAEGNLLAYTVNGPGTRSDIWVVAMDGPGEPESFLATAFDERLPDFHPGGRWIAYTSNEAGSREVYVTTYPDGGTTWQVSTGGGDSPLWSRDGRELYFVAGTRMMVVSVSTEPTLNLSTPVVLFDDGVNVERGRNFDVAPDGRFVTPRRSGKESGLQELRLLLNWPQEIARVSGTRH
jgi:serine/threonine-protein kinase